VAAVADIGSLGESHVMALSTFQKSPIDFVLVSIAGDGPELSARVSQIFAIAVHHGSSARLIAATVMLTYGAQSDLPRSPERFHALIENLRKFGPHIRAVYGSELGHSGLLAGPNKFGFHIMLPRLTEAQSALLGLKWGEIGEFKSERNAA
jgi:hypothetical protein